jgi:hypothetical protein
MTKTCRKLFKFAEKLQSGFEQKKDDQGARPFQMNPAP